MVVWVEAVLPELPEPLQPQSTMAIMPNSANLKPEIASRKLIEAMSFEDRRITGQNYDLQRGL